MELVFVEPKTSEEAQVVIDQDTGKVWDAYVSRDSGIFDEEHEDAARLSGFTWRGGSNSSFLHCNDPERFMQYLLDEWELTGEDKVGWDALTLRWPGLFTAGT